ncbi:MAG TPA: NAD(P)-dependent oxidoreductase [Lacunisphaera sp.]|nr:NAD(P)-dependent oxidoreductase [Lacunisphaera sp.]
MARRIAITGAEGLIGGVLRAGLGSAGELVPVTLAAQSFPSIVADIADEEALVRAFTGIDAVVHLAATVTLAAEWPEVLRNNIGGTRNVFEAAVRCGVRKVVFASSGHVLGGAEQRAGPSLYDLDDPRVFDETTPTEPDTLYAVSKVQGEALGYYYARERGLPVISVRCGALFADNDPKSPAAGRGRSAKLSLAERYPRIRAKWLSHGDCCQLVRCCLEADVAHAVVFGTSNNPRQIWSLRSARALGYAPQDAAPREL